MPKYTYSCYMHAWNNNVYYYGTCRTLYTTIMHIGGAENDTDSLQVCDIS